MDFYYANGTCAQAIHILLEEIGQPFTPKAISFAEREQYGDTYKQLNPKSKVPVLVLDDGAVLTELPAIAFYLARSYPAARLLPEGVMAEVRALELLEYITATVHMRGFTRVFRPETFNATDREAARRDGFAVIEAGMANLSKALGEREYLLGQFSIADTGLFVLAWWAIVRLKLSLPANISAHYARMLQRPAVQRMMARENAASQASA